MKKRKFEDWEFEQVQNEFGYTRHYEGFAPLERWRQADKAISADEKVALTSLAKRLFYYVETWNEDELKFFFISPLTNLVDFQQNRYKLFAQRKFEAIINDWQVNGVVDFVVARGLQNPVQPFFFLHEYKQERKRDNDPLGQLLIAMVVAQHQNETKIPLYGCYVIGRNYFFVVLDEQEYAVSPEYDASSEDIMTIFKMFRFVKRYIEIQVSLTPPGVV